MAGFLVLLLLSESSQNFFELDLPRIAVLTAAVGIVAVTGAAMIGTLRAVGWIRLVPEMLEGLEVQGRAGRLWRAAWVKMKALTERPAEGSDTPAPVTPPGPQPQVPEEPPIPYPKRRGEPIEWFDPDVDPVEILNDPTE